MSNELGGRTDKMGNRYEKNCIIKSILDVVAERISSCKFEGLGNEEIATDIITTNFEGEKKYIQCKQRYASNDNWTFSGLKSYNLLKKWKVHLDEDKDATVSLETPIPFTRLTDLINRAKNNNGDAKEFYEYQIKSSKDTSSDFEKYCDELELDINNMQDVQKAMDYLRRTEVEDISDNIIYDYLNNYIKLLFFGNAKDNYQKLLDLVCNGDIMGKNIDIAFLYTFFNENNMTLNDLSNSESNFANIAKLNEKFKNEIILINNDYIDREELNSIISNINDEKSIMITGKAGYGKSGIIYGLINYLEKNNFQYLAIKLDKNVPDVNSLEWSENLGFNTYLSTVLDKFSIDKKCILILDQLDALRWTITHSRNALSICDDIIKEINTLNAFRKNKISVVLVCRSYDYENDPSIRKIVDENSKKWTRIDINNLNEECVKKIVGIEFDQYNNKLKQLLKIPCNLFIFMKIKREGDINGIHSTCDLITKWWEQISREGIDNGFSENDLTNIKEYIVEKMNQTGKISLPNFLFTNYSYSIDFLLSKSLLIKSDNMISFSHQSLLDYFSVEKMIKNYISGEKIEVLIGSRDKQYPNIRYQLQMFLERLYEIDDHIFLECIDSIINSKNIRPYLQYVAFEVLGDITNLSQKVKDYIMNNYNKKQLFETYINIVFMNHQEIIELLINNKIFDEWIIDQSKKKYVIDLLRSINYSFNDIEYKFIKKYIIVEKKLDKDLYSVFPIDVVYDTDDLFELRLELYDSFNELIVNSFLNLDELLELNEKRAIIYIKFLGEHLDLKKKHIKYSDDCSIEYEGKSEIKENKYIISELLPLIPETHDEYGLHDWEENNKYERNIQRIIITLLKKATQNLIKEDYKELWEIYSKYLNKGFSIHNELILFGLLCMPYEAANDVFSYLFKDINNNCFEYTSDNEQSISMLKEIVKKYINTADRKTIEFVVKSIIEYKPKDMVEKCKRNIDYKKENFNSSNYLSFWGDFQFEILNIIPNDYLDERGIQLKQVLNRRFSLRKYSIYDLNRVKSGSVISPVADKKISLRSWLKILTNKEIKSNHKSRYDSKKSLFIDSGLYEFQASLSSDIKERPNDFIDLFINNASLIISDHIYTLYNTLAYSSLVNEVSTEKFEQLFNIFNYKSNYNYAPFICEIISRKDKTNWSAETIKMLLDIYEDIKCSKIKNNYIVENGNSDRDIAEEFETKVINSSMYKLSSAISNILWSSFDFADCFIKIVEEMANSDDDVVKYSSMTIINSLINYNFDWAISLFISLFSNDYMYGYRSNRKILYYFYEKSEKYRDKIRKIVLHGLQINSKIIQRVFSYLMVDLYIFHDEYEKELLDVNNTKEVKDAIIEMLLEYLKEKDFKEKTKQSLIKLASYKDTTINPYRLFDDKGIILKDSDFIIKIFEVSNSQELIEPFIHILKKKGKNILEYSDLLLEIINVAIKHYDKNNPSHYYAYSDLNYLIIMLFDYSYDNSKDDLAIKCLDIWDQMFLRQIGIVRQISKELSNI